MSHDNEKICKQELLPLLKSSSARVTEAAKECLAYLQEESIKLENEKSLWHISSDILESIFGIYKAHKSPNGLNGVTSHVLMLPLLTKSNPKTGCVRLDFKEALEHVFLRDIDKWKEDNLSENLAIKRRKTLNAS